MIKVYAAIFVVAIVFALAVFIRDDIKMRSMYNQANESLIQIQRQYALNEKLQKEVMAKQDENNQKQDKALVEMHNKGYLGDSNGDNPDWMCSSDTGCH